MKPTVRNIVLILVSAAGLVAYSRDDSQQELRENPDMSTANAARESVTSIEIPSYINIESNHIDMNGADWTDLVASMASSGDSIVNIVHIGDSHLQADMATAVTRRRLGEVFGSAGRALIVPFKLAGTNEPVDYSITSSSEMVQARLLKTPWPIPMGFTGIAVRPADERFELTITAREPFDSIQVFYSGDSLTLAGEWQPTQIAPGIVGISTGDTCSSATLSFASAAPMQIHGFNLINGNSGVAYHVIGNNGATYGTYNGVDNFADDVATLNPSLIIVSLGTNEAFGRITDSEMRFQMRTLLDGLRKACPEAKLLLTTPAECQRRTYRGKGRKRRSAGYAVNLNVKRLRKVILEMAESEGLPVYDFYAVAGGDGSSAKWLADGKMNKDRVHLLRPGYTLQGELFTRALLEKLATESQQQN